MIELSVRLGVAGVAHQSLGNYGAMWLVMTEICLDGARPIDVRVTRSASTLRTIERTTQSLKRVVFEPAHQVVHDFANHLARGFQRFAWNGRAQGDEVRDKVNIASRVAVEIP